MQLQFQVEMYIRHNFFEAKKKSSFVAFEY